MGSLDNVIENVCLFPAILGTKFATPQDLVKPGGLQVLEPYVDRNIPGSGPFTAPSSSARETPTRSCSPPSPSPTTRASAQPGPT